MLGYGFLDGEFNFTGASLYTAKAHTDQSLSRQASNGSARVVAGTSMRGTHVFSDRRWAHCFP